MKSGTASNALTPLLHSFKELSCLCGGCRPWRRFDPRPKELTPGASANQACKPVVHFSVVVNIIQSQ